MNYESDNSFYSAEANVELRKLMMMHRSFSYEGEGDGGPQGSKIEIYFRRHKFSTIILMDFCEASRMVKGLEHAVAGPSIDVVGPGDDEEDMQSDMSRIDKSANIQEERNQQKQKSLSNKLGKRTRKES